MKCDVCEVELQVGQWPWCPHEDARGFGDAPIEPYFDENITSTGEWITTRAQRRRIMSKNNLDYHDVSKKRRGRLYIDLHR